MYQIKIIKTEANPKYAEELAAYNEVADRNMRGRFGGEHVGVMPEREFPKNVLIVELTEEQYKKVKAAVFSVFQ